MLSIKPLKSPSANRTASSCTLFIGLTNNASAEYPITQVVITATTKITIDITNNMPTLYKYWFFGIAITHFQFTPSIVVYAKYFVTLS